MITPNNVNFTYKKYNSIPPAVLLTHDVVFNSVPTIPAIYANYLELYDATLETVKIRLKAPGADSLAVGLNTFSLTVELYDVDLSKNKTVGNITLNITVEDTIVLSVSPTNISYNYQIGGTAPSSKLISVSSENDWTLAKNAAWLSLSTASGSGSGSFNVSVITTGLTSGSYTDTITVNDGVTTKTIAVNFTVTDANTGTDYLYVSPTNLSFGFTVGGTIPPSKNIELNASTTFTASVNETWVNLPTTSGVAGPQVIQAALLNNAALTALAEGEHYATITITSGAVVKTVIITLTVYDVTAQTPSNTNLLFTEEENTLSLKSSRLDTFMQLNYTTNYNSVLFNYTVELPFFKGLAERNIGLIPKKIIGDQFLIGLAETAVFQPYFPLLLNIELHEKELFTEAIVATSSVNGLKFIKGYKPTTNLLSEISRTIFLTTKATLCFSVLSENASSGNIEITGTITKTINVTDSVSADKDFYTVVIPIASMGNFWEGHELNITFLGETITVVIIDEGVDHTMVFWENENGCFDALELTGEVAIDAGIKRKTATFRGDSKHTTKNKVLEILKPRSYKVNTGIVRTKESLEMIYNMLSSKNLYLQTQGITVAVIPSTSEVPTFTSLDNFQSFDINFNTTEE
jgi:hypothetical protein